MKVLLIFVGTMCSGAILGLAIAYLLHVLGCDDFSCGIAFGMVSISVTRAGLKVVFDEIDRDKEVTA